MTLRQKSEIKIDSPAANPIAENDSKAKSEIEIESPAANPTAGNDSKVKSKIEIESPAANPTAEISHNDDNEILQHCNSNKIEIKKQRKNEIEIKMQRMIENAIYKMKNSNRQDPSAASNKMKEQATNIFTC